jgi:hypothetical protein
MSDDDNTGTYIMAGLAGLAVGLIGTTIYSNVQASQAAAGNTAAGSTNLPLMGLAELAFAGGLGLAAFGVYEKSMWMQALGLGAVALGGVPLVLSFDGVSNGPIAQLTTPPATTPAGVAGSTPGLPQS